MWSPSGTKIAFVSGHHLTPDSNWANGKFEPGVEVWMVNADGSGTPTRLTYNDSYDGKAAWWAPLVFTDVPRGTWAYNAINTCYEANIVHGYSDGTYQPGTAVDRGQMAVYIARVLTGGTVPAPSPGTQSFTDVPTDFWAYNEIEYCKGQNVVQGYGADYQPATTVDRGQMSVFIARAVSPFSEWPNLPSYTPPTTPSFPDVPTTFWAYAFIEFCKAQGVVKGYSDGTYQPGDVVSRDQMSVYIAWAFKLPM